MAFCRLFDVDRSNMKSCGTLLLQLVMLDRGAFTKHDFGHRIGEVTALSKRHMVFDNAGRTTRFCKYRLRGWIARPATGGDEKELDRCFDDGPWRMT